MVAGALVSPLVASAQSSSGPILGFYKFTVPQGSSVWSCGLVKKKDHQGQIDGLTTGVTSVITENDRTFGLNEFGNHYLEVLSGPWTGLVLDIVSNGANTITVQGDLGPFGLAGNEAFAVREHVTLGDLFPQGGGLLDFQDTITLFYSDGSSKTFLFGDLGTGTMWLDPETFGSADGEPIYPGQGFLVNAFNETTLLVGQNGVSYVKDTPTIVPCYRGAVNLVGLVNPLVATDPLDPIYPSTEPLQSLGLLDVLPSFGDDAVSLFSLDGALSDGGTFIVFDFGGGSFFTDDGATDRGNTPVQVGTAFNVNVVSSPIVYYQQPVLHPVN